MRQLPTGTVTFLFTDIEGSTKLLQELGDAYADAVAEHRRVLREAFTRHGGVEVDTQGDAFFVAFPRAKDALAAAREGQAALAEGPIRVRMGLHTGEPVITEEGYVGIDVHRAARIASAGYGGQVLVSQSTHDLSGEDGLRDLGEHRLKDLAAPERIYQFGLESFPPLKSLNATNLPVIGGPFVGRRREVDELVSLVRAERLVTLTGPGGTGKTRLGLQVAAELVAEFPAGVFFVRLAGVERPEAVASAITSTLGVHELADLRDRRMLLLVDNFEHLLDAAPTLALLLETAPAVKAIVTSRAPLRIAGEHEYPVDPLPEEDAVALLTAVAQGIRTDFRADGDAAEICRRLDGLPLAIELAASRLRTLAPPALLERLDHRLPLLTAGRRDAPTRQRTLRATIEWSYDLLTPELQRAFARLAVLSSFELAAAEAVAGAGLDEVDALVEASLLKRVTDDRFLMLDTIRELGLERLDGSGEGEAIRRGHAEFFAELAERANLTVEASGAMQHRLVIPEHDNVRAALRWATEAGEGELGLRLALALENFWVTTDPAEGVRSVEALLPLGPSPPHPRHAHALRSLGNCYSVLGDDARGERLYEESLAEFRRLGDDLRVGIALDRLAGRVTVRGDLARARQLLEEALELHRRSGFKKGEATSLGMLANVERHENAPLRALDLYDRSLALARKTGFTWWAKNMLLNRSNILFELGESERARESAVEALDLSRRIGDRSGIVFGLALTARGLAEEGTVEGAGRLWGALEAEFEHSPPPVERAPLPAWDDVSGRVQSLLFRSDPEFERGRAEGRHLSLDEAVDEAAGR